MLIRTCPAAAIKLAATVVVGVELSSRMGHLAVSLHVPPCHVARSWHDVAGDSLLRLSVCLSVCPGPSSPAHTWRRGSTYGGSSAAMSTWRGGWMRRGAGLPAHLSDSPCDTSSPLLPAAVSTREYGLEDYYMTLTPSSQSSRDASGQQCFCHHGEGGYALSPQWTARHTRQQLPPEVIL